MTFTARVTEQAHHPTHRRRAVRLAGIGVALTLWGRASVAHASTPGDVATAEVLFQEGRKLLLEGNYREACPKFAASQKFDPALGTAINLADCLEKLRQTASAWARFIEVAEAARKAGDAKRETAARERVVALEQRLSRLAVVVPDAARLPDLLVQRDGLPLDEAVWGTAVPVDPGRHVVEARAPGRAPWAVQVDVPVGPSAQSVEVPPLDPEATRSAVQDTPLRKPPQALPNAVEPRPAHKSTWPVQRTLALTAAGVGLVGVGVGVVTGLMAQSQWNEVKAQCDVKIACLPEQARDAQTVGTLADVSTTGYIVAGAASVAAAVLWFTAPTVHRSTGLQWIPSVGQGTVGLVVAGSYR